MTERILVAEDDRAIRESLTRALELEGYDVTGVGDGAAALIHAAHADLLARMRALHTGTESLNKPTGDGGPVGG